MRADVSCWSFVVRQGISPSRIGSLLVMMGVVSCSDFTAPTDPFSPVGVSGLYNLESVNGRPIPFSKTETQNGETVSVATTDGSVSLNANSTFGLSFTFRFTLDTETATVTGHDSGTFVLVEPSTVRLTFSDGEIISATLDGDRLTIADDGNSLVFRK